MTDTMNALERIGAESLGIAIRDNQARVNSLAVAERFGKRHDNIIRDIETKIFGVAPDNFTHLNFEVSEYIDATGRRLKSHDMTRDGFTLLAMGFTGPRAMLWKVMYIEAFNIMAAMLQGSSPGETVQTHIRQLRFLESYFPESQ